MKIKRLSLVLVTVLVLWSCGKDDGSEPAKNSAPIAVEGLSQNVEVFEDLADTEVIMSIEATDPENDKLTFFMKTNGEDLFEITVDGDLGLAEGKNLDYETTQQHQVVVVISDGVNEVEVNVTIMVGNIIESLAEDPASFITVWKTTNANETITIGTNPGYAYSYTVDWGDGTAEEQLTTQNPSHQYEEAGTFTVAVQGTFPSIVMDNTDAFSKKALVSIEQWGTLQWQTMKRAFMGCENMVYKAQDKPDLSLVTNLNSMFANAKAMNADLSSWNVSGITNMGSMFAAASSFNGNISNWDVIGVADMSYMFYNAEAFAGDISSWHVNSLGNMYYMFNGASAFNADLSQWTVTNVLDMSGAFANATSFNSDISGWDVTNVSSMWAMFYNASDFDQDLGGWEIASVTNLENMLDGSGMSRTNYEATLIGWSNLADNMNPNLNNITLGADGLEYCSEDAVLSHGNLKDIHGWQIVGDTQNCN